MILLDYLPWLLGTLMLEVGAVAALAPRPQRRRALWVCLAVNLCTHPLAFLLQRVGWYDMLSLELLVAVGEGLVYWRLVPLSPVRASVVTVAANLLSTFAGLVTWAVMLR